MPRIDSCVHFSGDAHECGTWYCQIRRAWIDVSCEHVQCDACEYYREKHDEHQFKRLF